MSFLPGISVLVFILFGFSSFAQSSADLPRIDRKGATRLLREVNKGFSETRSLNLLGAYYESISKYDSSRYFLNKSIKENKGSTIKEKIFSYNILGWVYWHESAYDSSLKYHFEAQRLCKQIVDPDANGFTALMLGNDHYDLGDYVKTSEYYFSSLRSFEQGGIAEGEIMAMNRLSKLYFKLKDQTQAKLFAENAIRKNRSVNYLREFGTSFNCLGNIFIENDQPDSALFYFRKTLQTFQACGDIIGQSVASINLGDTYQALAKRRNDKLLSDSSLFYYQRSYDLNTRVSNRFGMIYGLAGVSDVLMEKKKFHAALVSYREALSLARSIDAKSEVANLYWKLHRVFEALHQKDSAYHYLQQYVSMKEKVEADEQKTALLRQESRYQINKKQDEHKAELEKQKILEQEKSKWKNYVIAGIILLVLLLAFAVYESLKRLKVVASKNAVIHSINDKLTVQQKEITDSITYARRIQEAILPSDSYLNKVFPKSFVFYQPKAIVAGDFYWLETRDDKAFIAVADCTGHGVPGAMVSVVCSNALNRSLLEFGLTDPGQILDKTRSLVLETFSHSDRDVKDGMDISLAVIDFKAAKLEWAGANSPLLIIRKGEMMELTPTKQAIGKTENAVPFRTNSEELKGGEAIYFFTDGFADQFGGSEGKKFKKKALKELLFQVSVLDPAMQKMRVSEAFLAWKGDLEQVDDVCVVGLMN